MDSFSLSGPDNDSSMLVNAPASGRCASCGRLLDSGWIDPLFLIAERRFDLSFTYDGYCIVSERFRSVVADRGARYVPLPSEPSFFALFSRQRVPFDAARRQTRFTNRCSECGRWHDVAGATPAFLLEDPRRTSCGAPTSSLGLAMRNPRSSLSVRRSAMSYAPPASEASTFPRSGTERLFGLPMLGRDEPK